MRTRNSNWKRLFTILCAVFVTGLVGCGEADTTSPTDSTEPAAEGVSALQGGSSNGGCQIIDHSVRISSQADLQAYAGMNCFRIRGHLFIQNTTDINDLSALSGLQSVSGYLAISDNTELKSATAIEDLRHVGQGLVVEGNHKLERVEFKSLRYVGGYLHVFNNAKLEAALFPWLTTVNHDVIFAGLNNMTELDLSMLVTIWGKFIYEHSDSLEWLCLPKLVHVEKSFIVHFNGALKGVSAPWLKSIGGDLEIERNPEMTRLWLASLVKVGGKFIVIHHAKLDDCLVTALAEQIDHIGGDIIDDDNKATCETDYTVPPAGCGSVCIDVGRGDHGEGDAGDGVDELPGCLEDGDIDGCENIELPLCLQDGDVDGCDFELAD